MRKKEAGWDVRLYARGIVILDPMIESLNIQLTLMIALEIRTNPIMGSVIEYSSQDSVAAIIGCLTAFFAFVVSLMKSMRSTI
jgi:uncharacterized RDD family membrane protein YckC